MVKASRIKKPGHKGSQDLYNTDTFDGNRPQDGLTFTDSPTQGGGGDMIRQLLMMILGNGEKGLDSNG